jgi:hypothetical protein
MFASQHVRIVAVRVRGFVPRRYRTERQSAALIHRSRRAPARCVVASLGPSLHQAGRGVYSIHHKELFCDVHHIAGAGCRAGTNRRAPNCLGAEDHTLPYDQVPYTGPRPRQGGALFLNRSPTAQASAVLDHSRTLPQGDGRAGPAFAGGGAVRPRGTALSRLLSVGHTHRDDGAFLYHVAEDRGLMPKRRTRRTSESSLRKVRVS